MELALLLFVSFKYAKQVLLSDKPTAHTVSIQPAEPADASEEESLKLARKRYEEELLAFQDLLNYNEDVAYGISPLKEE